MHAYLLWNKVKTITRIVTNECQCNKIYITYLVETCGLCWCHCLLWIKQHKVLKLSGSEKQFRWCSPFYHTIHYHTTKEPPSCVTREINSPCTASTGDASLVSASSVLSWAPTSSGRQWLPASEVKMKQFSHATITTWCLFVLVLIIHPSLSITRHSFIYVSELK